MLELASIKSLAMDLSKYKTAMGTQKKLFRSILMMSSVASGKFLKLNHYLPIDDRTYSRKNYWHQ